MAALQTRRKESSQYQELLRGTALKRRLPPKSYDSMQIFLKRKCDPYLLRKDCRYIAWSVGVTLVLKLFFLNFLCFLN